MIYNIYEILDKAIREEKVVSVFTDWTNKTKCSVGFIYTYDKNTVVIQHLTCDGEEDGYAWRKIEDIYRIDLCGKYEVKLKKLYKFKNQKHCELFSNIKFNSNLLQIIYCAEEKSKIVEVSIDIDNEQELIVGFINCIIEDKIIEIYRVDDYGELDGATIINIEDIISLNFDSKDSKNLLILRRGQDLG